MCHGKKMGELMILLIVAGTLSAVSVGVIGTGAGLWYLRKVRAKAPVTCGVQSNQNRLF